MASTTDFDFGPIGVLTFDCYGTLIDWEAGIVAALRGIGGVGSEIADDSLLEAYASAEADLEAGPWQPYRSVVAEAMGAVCRQFGRSASPEQEPAFGASVADWPAFADSAAALARLRRRFDLGVITNCDDDLFAASNAKLGEPFRWVITAQQLRSYKPNPRNFEIALERIGRPRYTVLHVAQSLYHDHVPARAVDLASAWIDRRRGRGGAGATPVASAAPAITCPDMTTFADVALAT